VKLVTVDTLAKEAELLRMLVYGDPGTGKSWLLASACLSPATSPMLYIDYRGQVASLRGNPQYVKAMEDGRLVIVRLKEYEELNVIYTWLVRGRGSVQALDNLFPNEMPRTVGVDSITEIQRDEVELIAGLKTGKLLDIEERPAIQDWGVLLLQFTKFARLWYALPYHMIFAGLEAVDYAPRARGPTGKVVGLGEPRRIAKFRVALQGRAQREMPAYALLLMRLDQAPVNSTQYCVGTTRSPRAASKDQTGVRLPATIHGPTIPMLAGLLRTTKKEVMPQTDQLTSDPTVSA